MRVASLLLSGPILAGSLMAQQAPASLSDFAWLAGRRESTSGASRSEEHWSRPAVNMMLGMSRTVRGERVTEFEFLRIEQRSDGVFYVAQPNGRPPTLFKLTSWDGTEAVFENPEHDFPKRIIYRRMPDNVVFAKVDGGAGTRGPEFTFRPLP